LKRRVFVPVIFAALMALTAAVPVHAAEPTVIDVWSCDRSGGEYRVGRRSHTTLFYGWLTKARRQAVKFLDRSYVELTIDGMPVANADLLWSRPIQLDENLWAVLWVYELGRLGAGNSIDTNLKLIFTESHWDGFSTYPPGTYEDLDCRVFTRA